MSTLISYILYLPIAENFSACKFSSNELAAGLTFTNMAALPFPQKYDWKSLVSLLSLKGTTLYALQGRQSYWHLQLHALPTLTRPADRCADKMPKLHNVLPFKTFTSSSRCTGEDELLLKLFKFMQGALLKVLNTLMHTSYQKT